MSIARPHKIFLNVVRSPFYCDILPSARLPQPVPGWKVDMGSFEPSILVGDCFPHCKGEYKHALNSHFSCTDEDAFMFHEGRGSDEGELYLFSFMGWEDYRTLLELLNMPQVPATHHFDCTTGVVTPISSSNDSIRKSNIEDFGSVPLAPVDAFHDDIVDMMQLERDRDLCWYCDREGCYEECSQL